MTHNKFGVILVILNSVALLLVVLATIKTISMLS